MTHLKMHSLNKIDENTEKIAKLFPNCVTEAKDENGEIVHKIDFDMLRQELSNTLVEGREERYQFTWPDKRQAILTANAPINKTLRPCREESVDFDNTQNLYIEGDNLEVLKLLQETYLGKIKMIYIDPPYNTGNDFVYEDDFRTESLEFRSKSGNFDESGNQIVDRMALNTESNGRFHTDWLNMMYPRLKLAKDLLSDDGAIFISIDDNEVDNLKKICDEVFGESNKVAEFIVIRSEGGGMAKQVVKGHDYLFVFAKNILNFSPLGRPKDIRGKILEKNGEKYWIQEDWLRKKFGKYGNCYYEEILEYKGQEKLDEINKGLQTGEYVLIPKDNGMNIVGKLRNIKEDSSKFYSILKHLSAEGIKDLQPLNLEKYFSYPKPVSLIKEMILGQTFFSTNNGDIILDFFSGSATTAHAVMQLNSEDGGNRKFIMVQLPERTDEKTEAYKAGYKNICEIGKERIRRAGKQILELSLENLEKEGLIEKYARELPEIRSLEEVYGFSSDDIFINKETSKGGNLCPVGSDEKSCCIDSIEYCRGAVEGNKRIYPISKNSERFSCRIGNAIINLRTLELLNSFGYRIKSEIIGGNQQNDLFPNESSEKQNSTLSSKLSDLSSKLSTLNTDIGFRVLKCDSTNMEDVYYTPDHIDKADLFKSNVKQDRSAEDLLFQVMLDLGIILSSKIETKKIDGKKVFYVKGNYLVACFDENVTEETITKIAKEKPSYFVIRDSSMANDSVATNFEQIFKTFNPETIRKVL